MRRPGVLERLDAALHRLSVPAKRSVARVLVACGVVSLAYYFAWWASEGRALRPALWPLLLLAIVYALVQLLTAWYAYLRIEVPGERAAPPGLRVDVFVPVYGEDEALVETSLSAAVAIRYPHRTFLLDDAGRDGFRRLAERLGAVYVRRGDRRDAKAGNVNNGLMWSSRNEQLQVPPALHPGRETFSGPADFVTIFDVDHVPEPEYLDVVLGHFDDPRVGFVQPLVANRNQMETAIARASAGQADDVFGPTSMGWNGCGAALVWGAHCTFRRKALDSIDGYRPGLAEDLHTSLALHAAGWRSVYVPRLVARGLTTADLRAHFIQHLKWSRGVLGTLFEGGLARLARLSPAQIACYLTRMSYYLIGPVALAHILLLAWALFSGRDISSYLLHVLPVMTAVVLVRKVMGAMWEQDPNAGWQLTGTALALSTWPVYVLSLVCVLFRIPLPHLPTPKRASGGNYLPLVLPQVAAVTLLAAGIVQTFLRGAAASDILPLAFAAAVIAVHSVVLLGVWEGWHLAPAVEPAVLPAPSLEPFGVSAPETEPVRDVL